MRSARKFSVRSILGGWRGLAGVAAVVFFALIQTVVVAHASGPDAMAPDHAACVLCVSADRDKNAPAPAELTVEVALEPFAPPVASVPAIIVRHEMADPPARGPPSL